MYVCMYDTIKVSTLDSSSNASIWIIAIRYSIGQYNDQSDMCKQVESFPKSLMIWAKSSISGYNSKNFSSKTNFVWL